MKYVTELIDATAKAANATGINVSAAQVAYIVAIFLEGVNVHGDEERPFQPLIDELNGISGS